MNQTINYDDLHNDQTIILQSTSTRDYNSNDKLTSQNGNKLPVIPHV